MISLGLKMAASWGHLFYVGLYRENMKEYSCHRALVFGVSHNLVNLYQVFPKLAPSQGSHVLHRLIEGKHEKLFLSETERPRVLIFVM